MMTQDELKAIRARVEVGYEMNENGEYGTDDWTFIADVPMLDDVTALLAHIDAQQAVIDAARAFQRAKGGTLQVDTETYLALMEALRLHDALAGEGANDGTQTE